MTPQDLKDWCAQTALPLWQAHGLDHVSGGYFELLDADLQPVIRPKRARLTARQIYCFTQAPALGAGAMQAEAAHGLDYLLGSLVTNDKVISARHPDGRVARLGPDLYDDAFALLALAAVADHAPDAGYEAQARAIAERMIQTRGRADGGFSDDGTHIHANPLMHLLEAGLAWVEQSDDADGFWWRFCARLVRVALTGLIQGDSGILPEDFDLAYRPLPRNERVQVEPGHLFEWAWLLLRWSVLAGDEAAFASAQRLATTAQTHGIAPDGIIHEALDGDLRPRDTSARLWPQTERAKYWHAIAHHPATSPARKAQAEAQRALALDALARFLDGPRAGLWFETREADGTFRREPTRASSLYHIICAARVLDSDTVTKGRRSDT
ncbi:AGE family epimerase/isomerase [Celeribacter sp.]|uniref:AGE family epimerase/isomerase n=1 Tax=Celeribacter sp. TaxID=1890673 RepID=UPI003A90ADD3